MTASADTTPAARRIPLLIFAWLWVAAPFTYGVYRLVVNLLKLFQ